MQIVFQADIQGCKTQKSSTVWSTPVGSVCAGCEISAQISE